MKTATKLGGGWTNYGFGPGVLSPNRYTKWLEQHNLRFYWNPTLESRRMQSVHPQVNPRTVVR